MTSRPRPRFRIHRIDTPPVEHVEGEEGDEVLEPDTHYRAFWTIEDKTYRVQIWNHDEWQRRTPVLPSAVAPRSLNGRGWMVLQPIDRR